MKKVTLLFIFSCLILLQACNQQQDTQYLDDVTKSLTQYSTDWSEAIKSGDASKVVDLFAPDFMYQSGSGEIVNRDQIINDINGNANPIESYELKDIKVHLYGKDLANVTGAFNTKWVDNSGEEQLYQTRFTNVWKKNPGGWQCIIGHSNPLVFGNNETDLSMIKAIPTKAAEAINKGDLDAWLDLYDENARIMFNESNTLNGIIEIENELKRYWADPKSDISIEHFETKLLGDYAYGVGTDKGTERNPETGKIQPVNSREFVVFKKQDDGEWKVFWLMTNQNQ